MKIEVSLVNVNIPEKKVRVKLYRNLTNPGAVLIQILS